VLDLSHLAAISEREAQAVKWLETPPTPRRNAMLLSRDSPGTCPPSAAGACDGAGGDLGRPGENRRRSREGCQPRPRHTAPAMRAVPVLLPLGKTQWDVLGCGSVSSSDQVTPEAQTTQAGGGRRHRGSAQEQR